jgi:hypothetical protein
VTDPTEVLVDVPDDAPPYSTGWTGSLPAVLNQLVDTTTRTVVAAIISRIERERSAGGTDRPPGYDDGLEAAVAMCRDGSWTADLR